MRNSLTILIAILLLGGCSSHYHPLEASKKERLVSELIASAPECDAFKKKLTSPAVEDDAVDAIFHQALQAHCVKKDV